MIGAYLSVSIVSFVVIGYHCNHWDGQLNWQAFRHCIISRATKLSVVQLVISGMTQKASMVSVSLVVTTSSYPLGSDSPAATTVFHCGCSLLICQQIGHLGIYPRHHQGIYLPLLDHLHDAAYCGGPQNDGDPCHKV